MLKPTHHTQDQEWRGDLRRQLLREWRRFEERVDRIVRGAPPAGRVERVLCGHKLWLTAQAAAIYDLLLEADGWVSAEELLKTLGEQIKGADRRRALSQAVCRLKDEFEESGLDREAIECHRELGYRLCVAKRDRG